MRKTKIEWCDATWNPVTGCLHGCEYCYARRIAKRFKGCDVASTYGPYHQATWKRVNPGSKPEEAIYEVEAKCPPINIRFDAKKQTRVTSTAPYPWGFQPTLRKDKLGEPQHWKKPRTIFVCSMADLFGEWVPDEWIETVFSACRAAPQHRYLFLTKNPARYMKLAEINALPAGDGFWYGSTTTGPDMPFWWSNHHNTFVSIEPLMEPFGRTGDDAIKKVDWIVMGAMTGPSAKEHPTKLEWVQDILADADSAGVPVLMKGSLAPVVGVFNMRQEFPWGVR